ncbi:uncharacterized protein LOC125656234 [Ostrea edulis]|uniref:uncharacterized protein LOC125656234 n=1 Tax=Ostrea edulis TaxID=37623 RepID=UPI002095A5D4|nr:uncharacterized protein LOC125656234 [Ostrea edulis]
MAIEIKNNICFSVLKVFLLIISDMSPVKCASYCYYRYYYRRTAYHCYYYYYYYYYNSGENSAGTITGTVVGSVIGSIFFIAIVLFVCIKVFKKTNHVRVIVRPAKTTVSYINTSSKSSEEFFF